MKVLINHVSVAIERLADLAADRAQYLLRHGTMRAGLYAPRPDDQEPHGQDELYIIHSGTARLRLDDRIAAVEAGHLIFVPAGARHRFENVSDDFTTYVVFWGPQNGESSP